METTPEVIAIAKEVQDAWGTSLSGGRTMSIERALGITKMVLHLATEATTVRTVGDLTNAHLGRRISYGTPRNDDYGRVGVYCGATGDYPDRSRLNMFVGGGYESGVPVSTPCEVLS